MSPFQNKVNLTPAPAVAGDFASANPRASVLAGPGGLVAGKGGVTVGKFAWVAADGKTVHNYGTAPNVPDGFVHRDQQALITGYLEEASNLIPEGFPVTLFNEGDFWAANAGANASAINGTIYADFSDGSIRTTLPSGFSATGSVGSTNTGSLGATFTATAGSDDTQLVVTAVTGLISVGDTVAGTGITAGTKITGQVSGTPGGAGTYQLDQANTASAATITSFGSVMKTTVTTGLISVGDTVSGGAGFPVGATVTAQISGTAGGAGVYSLSGAGSAYTASATGVKTFGNVLDVTAVGSGTLAVGDAVTGTGLPANASIASQVSGSPGGVGVYTLNNAAADYAASTALTGVDGIAVTGFKFKSVAAVNELAKISSWGI
jgi:hypothetical protein